MSPCMGWDTGWVLLAQPGWVLAGVGTAACGILCPTPPHSPVCTYMYRLTILQPAHTPRAAPGHTLPPDTLPADTYMSLHTHVCPYTALCHPTQSLCPTALPAPVPHQCTPHQCTPHHPTVPLQPLLPGPQSPLFAGRARSPPAPAPSPARSWCCGAPAAGQEGHWAEPQNQHRALLQALWEDVRDHSGLW